MARGGDDDELVALCKIEEGADYGGGSGRDWGGEGVVGSVTGGKEAR